MIARGEGGVIPEVGGRHAAVDPVDAAVLAAKAKTKMSLGSQGNIKTLNEGLFEYGIDCGAGYRIYIAFDGSRLIVLFAGGDKCSQSLDIAKARNLLTEYRQRKASQKQAAKGRGKRL